MRVNVLNLANHSNLASLQEALLEIGVESRRVSVPEEISDNEPLLLPGIGRFDEAMNFINRKGFADPILSHGGKSAPLVGICLGMQILFGSGEERTGSDLMSGLGLLHGKVTSLNETNDGSLNIGWFEIYGEKWAARNAFFAHSYGVSYSDNQVATSYSRGGSQFVSVAELDGIVGFQFHPELSGSSGLALLSAALRLQ